MSHDTNAALLDAAAAEHGFPAFVDVYGRHSVADLFRGRRRSGLYVLHFATGEYYVGKTRDIVGRFAAHRRTHVDLVRMSFRHMAEHDIHDAERHCIPGFFDRLAPSGVQTRGIRDVPLPVVETDFDLVMDADAQERWCSDPDWCDDEGERFSDEALRSRYQDRYQSFAAQPFADDVTRVLGAYVRRCVPAYRRSEVAFWIASCLWKGKPGLVTRVNVGWQTTFEVSWQPSDGLSYLWLLPQTQVEDLFDIELGEYTMIEDDVMEVDDDSGEPLFTLGLGRYGLTKGGVNQLYLSTARAEDALALLSQPTLVGALREFALGIAKQGPSPWSGNHCLDLADALVAAAS